MTTYNSGAASHSLVMVSTPSQPGGILTSTNAIQYGRPSLTDCSSNACDAQSFTCVSSQCFDHQKDGTETDVDCGGANSCNRCNVGQACLVNTDCGAGHICSASHVCQ